MYFLRSRPKYQVTLASIRELSAFQTFLHNLTASPWLAQKYPPEMKLACEKALYEISALGNRHCIGCIFFPYRLNIILEKIGLPYLSIQLREPLDVVGYVNKALALINDFVQKYGNAFETDFFRPEKCPTDSVPFEKTFFTPADTLYEHYKRALE